MAVETSVEKEIFEGKERRTPPHRAERKREREKRTRSKTVEARVKAKRRNARNRRLRRRKAFSERGVFADANATIAKVKECGNECETEWKELR